MNYDNYYNYHNYETTDIKKTLHKLHYGLKSNITEFIKPRFRKFNPEILEMRRMRRAPTILIIGKRRMGKSGLVADLLTNLRVNGGLGNSPLIISPVKTTCEKYEELFKTQNKDEEQNPLIIHSTIIHSTLDNDIDIDAKVTEVFKTQQTIYRNQMYETDYEDHPEFIQSIIFDNFNRFTKLRSFKSMFFNNRFFRIPFIIIADNITSIKPDIRTNIDYVFISGYDNNGIRFDKKFQKKIYNYFCGMFPTFKEFQFNFIVTTNCDTLVIDNTSKSPEIKDCVLYC